ncbi:fluoride efflux transporter FluC [Demequina salsinemoris]|uniref:fluoride efflux transporter FluC n=1 Tax=Demequina salsinemoris TaxID=577470 RepID=UPI000781D542|nr:CrcB family protein [Demequina salsinemoris]
MRTTHPAVVTAAVIVGAAVGTTGRATLGHALPTADGGVPWATLLANAVGALLLGILVEWIARIGDAGGWRLARMGLGTGVMGGFTTYSSFAVETTHLLEGGHVAIGVGYALGSLVVGIVCAGAGLWIGGRLPHPASREAVAS